MNSKELTHLIQKLKGLNWCFFSGFAIEIYTNGKRRAKDLDILVAPEDIDIFAERLNCNARRRRFKKFNFFVDDYGFETKFENLSIEATSGFPKKRLDDGSIYHIFENKIAKTYKGISLFVEPLEEIIVHKANMFRPKDINDLIMLKDKKINKALLAMFIKDWKRSPKVANNLHSLNFQF